MRKLLSFFNLSKKEFYPLIFILLVSAFLRLYRIDEYLPFLGDEGRDVRVVSRFIKDFDLMFIGPRTSIGDMYLGPLYYYLIAPFLWLWNYSPTGPAVFVALLGTSTVGLVWYTAREWFGRVAAFSAAILYAVSPIIIDFSRHSWNPNIMPFFALLAIYSVWRIWHETKLKWFIILGLSAGSIIQSHYLGLLLFPALAWVILLQPFALKTSERKSFFLYTFISFGIFVLMMVPLGLFDYKHGWQNLNSLKKFFFERQTTVSAKPWNAIPQMWPFWKDHIVTRLLTAKDASWGLAYSLFFALMTLLVCYFWKEKNHKKQYKALSLLLIWLVVGLMGLGLLKQNIYDHYFGFLFPAPFLIIGAVSQGLWEKKRELKLLVIVIIASLTIFNLMNNPLKNPPQRQMNRVEEIDKKIIEESQGKPFNFGLIAKRNYEEGYLYFLELWGAPLREIDPQILDQTLTDQLFVVCEDPVCEPINNPKTEIAAFGWATVEEEWEVRGYKLYKLVHRQ